MPGQGGEPPREREWAVVPADQMRCCVMEISVAVKEELAQLRQVFPDERACEAYLFGMRWPNGFVCPKCGCGCYTPLTSRASYQCARCRRQTSITARTVMHRSKLPLTVWFSAARLFATHADITSVRLFEALFGISPQSARLLRRKFKQILAAFDGEPLEGLVEVDHAEVQLRAGDGSLNDSIAGKIVVAAAFEVRSGHIRVAQLADDSAASVEAFVRSNVKQREMLLTNGHKSYLGLNDYRHDPTGIGKTLGRMQRILRSASHWLRKHYGLRREDVEDALDGFVARENNRLRARHPSFDTLMRLALDHKPTNHWDMVERDNPRKGIPTARRNPRYRKTATGMRQDGSGSTRPLAASAGPHPPPRERR